MKDEIQVYICDDDTNFSNRLEKYIRAYTNSSRCLNITKFSSGRDLISAWYENFSDVVFLDIDMPRLDGFEVASKLIESNKSVTIIFVTNHDSFVYQVWDYKPFWFIRKSHLEGLQEVLAKLYKKIDIDHENTEKKCLLKTETCIVEIDIKNLVTIESLRHDLILCNSKNEKQSVRCKIVDAEEQLRQFYVARVQKGIMINCRYISRVTSREVILLSGDSIPIGRDRIESVKNIYQEYLRTI